LTAAVDQRRSSLPPFREVAFTFPADVSIDPMRSRLAELFELAEPEDSTTHRLYVDTFDRRLLHAGSTLHLAAMRERKRLVWSAIEADQQRAVSLNAVPAFAADLDQGSFRQALEEVIDVRRLLPVAEVIVRGREFVVRNKAEKTVARMALETWLAPGRRRGPLILRATPVRGYEKPFRKLLKRLQRKLPTARLASGHPIVALGLSDTAGAHAPRAPQIALDPAARTDVAAKAILQAMQEQIALNEEGTRDSLDPEFLHEFRVAVRRTRAALARFRGVFPARTVERFAREFKWLGSITGTLRDLDVYLIKYDGYVEESPDAMRLDLEPLRAHLWDRQAEERAVLKRHLTSARYKRLMRDWAVFLDRPVPDRTRLRDAMRPIGETGRARIWKLHCRVLKRGRRIGRKTPAQAIHDLRLDCKKLRYMMEFCRPLFGPKAITAQTRALKRLQDNLGDFNDLEVQQGGLEGMARAMEAEGRAPLPTAIAMGRLIEGLRDRQEEERQRFFRRFAEFDTKANRKRAHSLFEPRAAAEEQDA